MPAAPLRILVVLPMYGGSLPLGRYCASALSALGHSVRVFEAPLLHPGFTGLRGLGLAPAQTAQLENSFLQVVSALNYSFYFSFNSALFGLTFLVSSCPVWQQLQ